MCKPNYDSQLEGGSGVPIDACLNMVNVEMSSQTGGVADGKTARSKLPQTQEDGHAP